MPYNSFQGFGQTQKLAFFLYNMIRSCTCNWERLLVLVEPLVFRKIGILAFRILHWIIRIETLAMKPTLAM